MDENAIPSVEVIEEIICIYDDSFPNTDLEKRISYDTAVLIQKKLIAKRQMKLNLNK